jgi:spore coat polysaccharide biosynthesis protein SpsF
VVIIQARMGSTRLPGKVLREIEGRPMIDWVVDRARRIPTVDETVVATSTLDVEDSLVQHLHARGVPVVRGPEQDVLTRYVQAAKVHEATAVVRVTSDCPLLMPSVSGRVVQAFANSECDYASNTLERTYPRGLDTEVLRAEVLRQVDQETTDPADREHVTRYVWKRPDRFDLRPVTGETDRSDLRWTVDEEPDLELVRRVCAAFSPEFDFEYTDVLNLLDKHPEWTTINRHVEQKKC